MILNIVIYIFVVMELTNVIVMYFKPDFKYGNSMAVFKTWIRSNEDNKNRLFNSYMINWVANCKLIFIFLLLVIAIWGSETVKIFGVASAIISIGIYFFTLHPIIKELDNLGEIEPKGYSKKLGFMIIGFMVMFSVALILHLIIF